jgi:hypothetical protein
LIEGLIGLLIVILIVGIVAAVVIYCVDLLPIQQPFKQAARVLVLLIAVLIILLRALPLLGVAV